MEARTVPPLSAIAEADAARPAAIEVPSNRWLIHPVSRKLLPLAIRWDIHPNTVSIIGMICGAAAGWAYWHWRDPVMATLGFGLMIAWHICDGLDGKLARATGKASPAGRILDGLCDYSVFAMVLVPLALSQPRPRTMLAVALASGAAHALQSAWYEGERASWLRRAAGVFAVQPRAAIGGGVVALYDGAEARLGNRARPVDTVLAAQPASRAGYLAASAAILRQMAIFSANARTSAIWLACVAGMPWLYWLWELVGLSLLAPLFAWRLRRVEAAA